MTIENMNIGGNSESPEAGQHVLVDLDGDGVMDSVLSVDNDGHSVLISDADGNGKADTLVDLGTPDSDGYSVYLDTDEDGTLDVMVEDEDGEWDTGAVDTDGDGIFETPITDDFE